MPRKVGRPSRVSTADIAEAALAIGLDRATVRNVAERLGMSVPGLYHHVRTREELLAVAVAHSLGALELPRDAGQPLAEWLEEYARFVYDALVAEPELVGQILAGTIDTLRLAQHLERFLSVVTTRGFTVAQAYELYEHLTSAVTGAAASAIGRRAAASAGHGAMADLRLAAKAHGADEVPLVHRLVRSRNGRGAREPDPFAVVRVVIDALAGDHT
jgi:AcrR family transcriptional regulator